MPTALERLRAARQAGGTSPIDRLRALRNKPEEEESSLGLDLGKEALRGLGQTAGFTLGGPAGGAAGGAITEALIQGGEKLIPGGDDDFSFARIGTEAAIGAVAPLKLLKGAKLGSRLLRAGGSGARVGLASSALTPIAEEGRLPTGQELALGVGGGAVGGAAFGGIAETKPLQRLRALFGKKSNAPSVEPSPTPRAPAVPPEPQDGTKLADELTTALQDLQSKPDLKIREGRPNLVGGDDAPFTNRADAAQGNTIGGKPVDLFSGLDTPPPRTPKASVVEPEVPGQLPFDRPPVQGEIVEEAVTSPLARLKALQAGPEQRQITSGEGLEPIPRAPEAAPIDRLKQLTGRPAQGQLTEGTQEVEPLNDIITKIKGGAEFPDRKLKPLEAAQQKAEPDIEPIARLARLAQETRGNKDPLVRRLFASVNNLQKKADVDLAARTTEPRPNEFPDGFRPKPDEPLETFKILNELPERKLFQEIEAKRLKLLTEAEKNKFRENPGSAVKFLKSLIQGEKGSATEELAGEFGGAAAGGVAGATLDSEDRLRGGILGATAGFGGVKALRGLGKSEGGKGLIRRLVPDEFVKSRRETGVAAIEAENARIQRFPSLEKSPLGLVRDVQRTLQRHGASRLNTEQGRLDLGSQVDQDVTDSLSIVASRSKVPRSSDEVAAYGEASTGIKNSIFGRRDDIQGGKSIFDTIQSGKANPAEQIEFLRLFEEQRLITNLASGNKFRVTAARRNMKRLELLLNSGDAALIEKGLGAVGVRNAIKDRMTKLAANNDLVRVAHLDDRSPLLEAAKDFTFANILSGVRTQERNIIGNISRLTQDMIVNPVASFINPDVVNRKEVMIRAAATMTGVSRGLKDAMFSLRNGVNKVPFSGAISEETIGRQDTPRVEFTGGGANPFNFPGRGLNAADQFFRAIAFQQDRYGQAFTRAANEGIDLNSPKFREKVAELVLSPDIEERAFSSATKSVFQERPDIITQKLSDMVRAHPSTGFFLRFLRTPANILRQGLVESTPLGLRGANAIADPRNKAIAQAQVATGTAMLAPMAYMISTGSITGRGPKDPTSRKEWLEAGNRPYSFQPTGPKGPSIEMQLLQPVAVPAMLMADLFEDWRERGASEEDETPLEIAGQFLSTSGSFVLNQSYFRGLGEMLNSIDDPNRTMDQLAQQVGSSAIPFVGLSRDLVRATDPVVREQRSVLDTFKASIPGLSTSLQPRRTRFGDVIRREGNPIQRGLTVGPAQLLAGGPGSLDKTVDPVIESLQESDFRVGQPSRSLTVGGKKIELTDEQANLLQGARGAFLKATINRVVNSKGFDDLPKEVRQARIQKAIEKTRRALTRKTRTPAGVRELLATRRQLDRRDK